MRSLIQATQYCNKIRDANLGCKDSGLRLGERDGREIIQLPSLNLRSTTLS